MRIPIAAGLIALSANASADLSWEFVEERSRQAEELLEYKPAIEAIVARERAKQEAGQASPEEAKAYEELGKALAEHPEMAAVNRAEYAANEAYRQAVEGGNSVEISLAIQTLAEAKAARFHKAASIPELKQAIEKWQQAAIAPSAEENEAAASALEEIRAKLKALGEVIGSP